MFLGVIARGLDCHPCDLQHLWICNVSKCYPEMTSVVCILGSALNLMQHFTETKKKKGPLVVDLDVPSSILVSFSHSISTSSTLCRLP